MAAAHVKTARDGDRDEVGKWDRNCDEDGIGICDSAGDQNRD